MHARFKYLVDAMLPLLRVPMRALRAGPLIVRCRIGLINEVARRSHSRTAYNPNNKLTDRAGNIRETSLICGAKVHSSSISRWFRKAFSRWRFSTTCCRARNEPKPWPAGSWGVSEGYKGEAHDLPHPRQWSLR